MIPAERRNSVATFEIEATFIITGRGLVMAGRIIEGYILRGDIIEFSANAFLRQRKVNLVTAMRKLPPTDSDIGIVIECFNKEEMEELFGTADLFTLMKKANEEVGIVVVTDGPHGSYVIDGKKIYKAGMYKDVKVIDRAGAGDAFCSGFVAMVASGKSIEQAITYGSANSTSVVGKIGAKAGILRSSASLGSMKIQITDL